MSKTFNNKNRDEFDADEKIQRGKPLKRSALPISGRFAKIWERVEAEKAATRKLNRKKNGKNN